jgi:hypothetical protein
MRLCYLLLGFFLALSLDAMSFSISHSIKVKEPNKILHQIILNVQPATNVEKLHGKILQYIELGADLSLSVDGKTIAQKLGDSELSEILKNNEQFLLVEQKKFIELWEANKKSVFEARMKASGINF